MAPLIDSLEGITVRINMRNEHNPPHIHAQYGDDEVLLIINTGEVLSGAIPTKKLTRVRSWLNKNRDKCLQLWNAFNPHLRG